MMDTARCINSAALAHVLTHPDSIAAPPEDELASAKPNGEKPKGVKPTADPDVVAQLDPAELRFFARLLARKRLDVIEPIFSVSLPAARDRLGEDSLADEFWRWYHQPDSVPVSEIHADIAAAWPRFVATGAWCPYWLSDLSRYELMRWRAVFYGEPRSRPVYAPMDDAWLGRQRPVLAPGAQVGTFAVDVVLLLRTGQAGRPDVVARTTRLITWLAHHRGGPAARTGRVGALAYRCLAACDGSTSAAEVAGAVASDPAGRARVLALVRDLVAVGALALADDGISAERDHPGPV